MTLITGEEPGNMAVGDVRFAEEYQLYRVKTQEVVDELMNIKTPATNPWMSYHHPHLLGHLFL